MINICISNTPCITFLTANSFDGVVPSELGQLVDLVPTCETNECFTLYSNSLCGDVPSQLGAMSDAYLIGGADFWATFVKAGNSMGTSCEAPTSSPVAAPTKGKKSESDELFDETLVAAIGSLLFIAVIVTCFVSRRFYLYLTPVQKPGLVSDKTNSLNSLLSLFV